MALRFVISCMKRLVTRFALTSFVSAGAVYASAQVPTLSINGHVGYYVSSEFRLKSGSKTHLEGPELGLDLPFMSLPGLTVTLSPSIVFGGQLSSGGDADGYVYRLEAIGRTPISISGFYGKFGVGYSYTTSRGHDFNAQNSWGSSYTVGYSLNKGLPLMKNAIELTYHQNPKAQLRGFTLSLALGF